MSTPSSQISVTVALMGALKAKTPDGGRLELPAQATVDGALAALDIEPAQTQVVMRNGKPQTDRSQPLSDGDQLTVIPLVGGG